jgi:hypothetical protein
MLDDRMWRLARTYLDGYGNLWRCYISHDNNCSVCAMTDFSDVQLRSRGGSEDEAISNVIRLINSRTC